MFRITKHEMGAKGAFVKLVQLDTEDFAVIVRSQMDGRLHHKYIGPDQAKAEEIFLSESEKLNV